MMMVMFMEILPCESVTVFPRSMYGSKLFKKLRSPSAEEYSASNASEISTSGPNEALALPKASASLTAGCCGGSLLVPSLSDGGGHFGDERVSGRVMWWLRAVVVAVHVVLVIY